MPTDINEEDVTPDSTSTAPAQTSSRPEFIPPKSYEVSAIGGNTFSLFTGKTHSEMGIKCEKITFASAVVEETGFSTEKDFNEFYKTKQDYSPLKQIAVPPGLLRFLARATPNPVIYDIQRSFPTKLEQIRKFHGFLDILRGTNGVQDPEIPVELRRAVVSGLTVNGKLTEMPDDLEDKIRSEELSTADEILIYIAGD